MNKLYYLCFLLLSSVAFSWSLNSNDPRVLEKQLKSCEANKIHSKTCFLLKQRLDRLNNFAYELRINPLKYGQRVLALQEKLNDPTQVKHKHMQKQLNERLLVIKHLESPE